MKKLPYLLLLVIAFTSASLLPGCKESDNNLNAYEEWYNTNLEWLTTQQKRTNPDGTPYFTSIVPSWDPSAYVLIHYFNDRELTKDNLSPMYTSTVDTRYRLELCNGSGVDSSYLLTKNGPGIFRTSLSGVIEGWAIALTDMRVGDTAEVVIPYQWAYGTSTSTSIPPYSNLKFNMSLVDIYTYEVNPK